MIKIDEHKQTSTPREELKKDRKVPLSEMSKMWAEGTVGETKYYID